MKLKKEVAIRLDGCTICIAAGAELADALYECMNVLAMAKKDRYGAVVDISIEEKVLRCRVRPGCKTQCYCQGWRALEDDMVEFTVESFLRREGWMKPVAKLCPCPTCPSLR